MAKRRKKQSIPRYDLHPMHDYPAHVQQSIRLSANPNSICEVKDEEGKDCHRRARWLQGGRILCYYHSQLEYRAMREVAPRSEIEVVRSANLRG